MTVQQNIASKANCDSAYPWRVRFTQRSAGVGTEKYRLVFPAQGGYLETIESISVTARER